MKKFWLAVLLTAFTGILSFAVHAEEKKSPNITRDNFVSLDYQSSGGIAALKTQIEIQGNEIILEEFPRFGGVADGLSFGGKTGSGFGLFSGQEITTPRPRARLSNNQLEDLIKLANKSQLPALAGKYQQKALRDGLNETLSLTISDEKNQDRTYLIENYGNQAPAAFYQFTAYLRQLRLNKFRGTSESVSTANPLVTRQNFQKLTFATSGGFAGLQNSIDVDARGLFSDFHGVHFFWKQTIGGKTTDSKAEVFEDEMSELIRLINQAKLPELNGKYFKQPQLADGFNETFTLTLTGGRQFTVSNYGDKAPPEYYALTQYLRELQQKKVNADKQNTALQGLPAITRDNFVSIQWSWSDDPRKHVVYDHRTTITHNQVVWESGMRSLQRERTMPLSEGALDSLIQIINERPDSEANNSHADFIVDMKNSWNGKLGPSVTIRYGAGGMLTLPLDIGMLRRIQNQLSAIQKSQVRTAVNQ